MRTDVDNTAGSPDGTHSEISAKVAALRKEYTLAAFRRRDLSPDPIIQFKTWLQQAIEAQVAEPSAMTLATADTEGWPSARTVLLKGIDERGLGFFTNYESRKARELNANPRAALVFHWPELERQVCIRGEVSKLSRDESEIYFKSRPRGNCLGAWVSNQGQVVASREVLEQKLAEIAALYPQEIPLPPYWGGFVLAPVDFDFWQGRPNRLHDRFRYLRQPDSSWVVDRLAP